MSKSYDDEIPASTLGGAADKFIVQRIDGRYVPVEPPGPLHIHLHRAPDIDPEKLAAFKNEPGPPSVIESIINSDTYQDKPWRYPKPLLTGNPPTILVEVRESFKAISAEEQRRIERGEMSADEAVAAVLQRYSDLEHDDSYQTGLRQEELRQRQGFFDAGELITADTLRGQLDISSQALEQALLEHRMFSVPGPNGEVWYPAFFLDPNRADIERISVALGDIQGLKKWKFFISEWTSLCSNTPLIALQFADEFGEQGWFDYVFDAAALYASKQSTSNAK